MITLNFTSGREPIQIQIANAKITYFDRKWANGVPFMPKNSEFVKMLLKNQRKFPLAQQIAKWILEANSGKNLEEYESCKSDEELAEKVRRDAKSKGLVEIK